MRSMVIDLETINRDAGHPDSSVPKGWEESVVPRNILEANQPRPVVRPADTGNRRSSEVVGRTNTTGGIASQSPRKETGPLPRVFVIDDEDFIRDLYRDVFEARGMTVFSAQNGDEAVNIFRALKYKPDIIIMDHRMPGKDGIETTKEILKMDPSVPIIFSSADETVREQALAAGAVSFWAKPFPVTHLVNAMIDLVEARKKREGHHFH